MNLDQATLTHIAIGAAIVFFLLRNMGWQKPSSKQQHGPTPGPMAFPPGSPYYYPPPPPPAGNAVSFDIPNLPVKAVITLQPEGDKK